MGLRTQLKNIIKKAIGRDTNAPAPPPYTPPTPKPEPVVAPVQPEPIETTEHLESEEQVEEQPPPEVMESSQAKDITVVEPKEEKQEEQEDSSSEEESSSSSEEEAEETAPQNTEEVDTEGAFAVYPIKNLFGESCPNCGASTFNNWAYSDNEFVCQSCDSTL